MKTYKEAEVECPKCGLYDWVEFEFEDFPRELHQTDSNNMTCTSCGQYLEITCTAEFTTDVSCQEKEKKDGNL